jgi:hypothetical protein
LAANGEFVESRTIDETNREEEISGAESDRRATTSFHRLRLFDKQTGRPGQTYSLVGGFSLIDLGLFCPLSFYSNSAAIVMLESRGEDDAPFEEFNSQAMMLLTNLDTNIKTNTNPNPNSDPKSNPNSYPIQPLTCS